MPLKLSWDPQIWRHIAHPSSKGPICCWRPLTLPEFLLWRQNLGLLAFLSWQERARLREAVTDGEAAQAVWLSPPLPLRRLTMNPQYGNKTSSHSRQVSVREFLYLYSEHFKVYFNCCYFSKCLSCKFWYFSMKKPSSESME